MIAILLFVWLMPFVMAQISRPAIGKYYLERYGKTWQELDREHQWFGGEVETLPSGDGSWFFGWLFWPFLFPLVGLVYGGDLVWEKALKPVMEYPGKLLAQNIKSQEGRGLLPPHVKKSIEEDAWQEVEDFLKNKQ